MHKCYSKRYPLPSASADGHGVVAPPSAFDTPNHIIADFKASIRPTTLLLILRFSPGYSGSGYGGKCSSIFIALHFISDYALTCLDIAPFCACEDLVHPQSPNGTTCISTGCNEMKPCDNEMSISAPLPEQLLGVSKGAHVEVSVVPE